MQVAEREGELRAVEARRVLAQHLIWLLPLQQRRQRATLQEGHHEVQMAA